jgi:hypothetical protein
MDRIAKRRQYFDSDRMVVSALTYIFIAANTIVPIKVEPPSLLLSALSLCKNDPLGAIFQI